MLTWATAWLTTRVTEMPVLFLVVAMGCDVVIALGFAGVFK
jgi:riboflavin synthase